MHVLKQALVYTGVGLVLTVVIVLFAVAQEADCPHWQCSNYVSMDASER